MTRQMKSAKLRCKHKEDTGVPSFEACLIHVLDSLKYERDTKKRYRIGKDDRHMFMAFERHPEWLLLPRYQKILRKLLERQLPSIGRSRLKTQTLGELREFLFRYENLSYQIAVANADEHQVLWSLACRFFIPWLALRIAFGLRGDGRKQWDAENAWFVPLEGQKLASCFIKVVDQYVRIEKPHETDDALQKRLYPEAAATQDAVKQGRMEESMGRDLRRYRSGHGRPTDAKINRIVKAAPSVPNLRTMLILARAIDRNVQMASDFFGPENALKLVKWLVLSYGYFRHLPRLRWELPADNGSAWLQASSRTFIGNTPMDSEWYYPLTDQFGCELARKINVELECSDANGRLAEVPQTEGDLSRGQWPELRYKPLPEAIERQLGARNFSGAVNAAKTLFASGMSQADAQRVGNNLGHLGRMAYDPELRGKRGSPSEEDGQALVTEAVGLLHFVYLNVDAEGNSQATIDLVGLLLEPFRPKQFEDHPLAQSLVDKLETYYRRIGRKGSAMLLRGRLLWLEGHERAALRMFQNAVNAGKESSGGLDWIWLLRWGTVLADKLDAKRVMKRFQKLAQVYGVFSGEAAPRTKCLLNELRYQDFKAGVIASFKPFPNG